MTTTPERPPGYPSAWAIDAVLADGGTVHIRPIRPDDASRASRLLRAAVGRERVFPLLRSAVGIERSRGHPLHDCRLPRPHGVRRLPARRHDRDRPLRPPSPAATRPRSRSRSPTTTRDADSPPCSSSISRPTPHPRASLASPPTRSSTTGGCSRSSRTRASSVKAVPSSTASSTSRFDIEPTGESLAASERRAWTAGVAQHRANPGAAVDRGHRRGAQSRRASDTPSSATSSRAGFTGPVYPVNPNVAALLGLACSPDVEAIDGPVDLAVLAIPAAQCIEAVDACGRKGVKGLVVISSGFAEVGAGGIGVAARTAAARAPRRHARGGTRTVSA